MRKWTISVSMSRCSSSLEVLSTCDYGVKILQQSSLLCQCNLILRSLQIPCETVPSSFYGMLIAVRWFPKYPQPQGDCLLRIQLLTAADAQCHLCLVRESFERDGNSGFHSEPDKPMLEKGPKTFNSDQWNHPSMLPNQWFFCILEGGLQNL